jgi:hypothetical protein
VKEQTGIQLKEANTALIQSRAQHIDFLDTLLVGDYERKHSVSSVYVRGSLQGRLPRHARLLHPQAGYEGSHFELDGFH